MAARNSSDKTNGRHAILDLAPLELDCLSVLWPIGEGTVREIRDALRESRPRAYTTIMTIMDRMAQKGIVSRRKTGRAWLYSPNVSAGEARERAVRRLVEHFFAGSPKALLAQLSNEGSAEEKVFQEKGTAEPAGSRPAEKRASEVEARRPGKSQGLDDSLL